jgi:hypothetical protein
VNVYLHHVLVSVCHDAGDPEIHVNHDQHRQEEGAFSIDNAEANPKWMRKEEGERKIFMKNFIVSSPEGATKGSSRPLALINISRDSFSLPMAEKTT